MTEVINSISDFEKYLNNTKKVVEEALDFSLGPENPEILRESMRYSLLAGGKRIRPILCLASCAPVSYTHLRAHETSLHLVCRLLLEKKKL